MSRNFEYLRNLPGTSDEGLGGPGLGYSISVWKLKQKRRRQAKQAAKNAAFNYDPNNPSGGVKL